MVRMDYVLSEQVAFLVVFFCDGLWNCVVGGVCELG